MPLARAPAGHCLEMESVCGKTLRAQIEALESYPSVNVERKRRILDTMRAKLERSQVEARLRNAARLGRRVRESVELHSGGDPRWLPSFVERVVYSGVPTPDAYRAFETLVLAAHRCPATGRFPPGLSRPC